ncbi:MAG: superoxide dismutase [Spirochaetales bacterium]
MPFTLPKLPYAFHDLEPAIDTLTMEIHWAKHHQAYINNANAALENTEWASWDAEKILKNLSSLPADKQTVLRNNVGGHVNHSHFWKTLAMPGKGGYPQHHLAAAIDKQLGGFEKFKTDFSKAALTRFGSGWGWLVLKADKTLAVVSTPNQDSPVLEGAKAILGIDVWEHAYYLHYQNRRTDYIDAFFTVVNWNVVNEIYDEAMK